MIKRIKRCVWLWISLFILIYGTSCSPQKRLARLIKRNPQLALTDTLYLKDTLILKESLADTVFYQPLKQNDTFVLSNERLEVKYFYSKDTVYLSGRCRDSIIIHETPLVQKIISAVPPSGSSWWKWLLGGFLSAFLLLIISRRCL